MQPPRRQSRTAHSRHELSGVASHDKAVGEAKKTSYSDSEWTMNGGFIRFYLQMMINTNRAEEEL